MFTRLEVENFYSFREREVLDLTIRGSVPEDPERFVESFPGSGIRVPKVVALYGANASGKTNLLRGLVFLQQFLLMSFNWPPTAGIPAVPFHAARCLSGATRFVIHFGARLIEDEPACEYQYELAIQQSPSGAKSVLSEVLSFSPKGRRQRILEREGGVLKPGPASGLRAAEVPKYALRGNASMISTLAQFEYPLAIKIQSALSRAMTNVKLIKENPEGMDINPLAIQPFYGRDPGLLGRLNKVISRFDLGVFHVKMESGPSGHSAIFQHGGLESPMSLTYESQGTQKFFSIFPLLDMVLQNDGLAILDELDTQIHPLLLPEIIGWFHDRERNPHNAGLIFSCHDASLLHFLAKEEVVFTEKDASGHTHVYGAQDIKGARRDDNLYRKYIGGVYGAIPRIG